MAPERLAPDNQELHRQINLLYNHDRFGKRMADFIGAVEGRERLGDMKGYARWLLMYERGRRLMKLQITNPRRGVPDYLTHQISPRHKLMELFYSEG